MKRLALRNMASGGALSMVRLVMGVAKIKIVALWLGVEGVGHFSLLTQIATAGTALISMSMAIPLINLGRPLVAGGNHAGAGRIAGTVLAVLAFNAALLILAWAAGGSWLLESLGIERRIMPSDWPILLAILAGAFASGFWEGICFLCDRFDAYIRANMTSALLDAVAIGSAAWAFGLNGAIYALPVAPVTLLLAYAVQLGRDSVAQHVLPRMRARLRLLPNIFRYCALMVATVSLTNLVQTWLRGQVLLLDGSAANGYLQVATALSSYLLSFVMTGFWGHLHARAAAEGDTPEVRRELRHSVQIGLVISFAGCIGAILMAPLVVATFYAPSFTPATQLLRPYMVGEFAFQTFSMVIAYQLAIGQRRRYGLLNLTYIGLLALVGSLLIPSLGAVGYVVAHVLSALVAVIAALGLTLRTGQFEIRQTLLTIALLTMVALASALLSNAAHLPL